MRDEKLLHHGGILFRGLNIHEPEELEKTIQAVSGESLKYCERSSPRIAVSGNIYTSMDYRISHIGKGKGCLRWYKCCVGSTCTAKGEQPFDDRL